jgi:hypothetical protein
LFNKFLDQFSRGCIFLTARLQRHRWDAERYSDDLRRKILTAHDRGRGTPWELAKRF